MKITRFIIFYYKSITIFLLIFLASTIPASEVNKVAWISFPNLDKLVHLGMYFCFSFVLIVDISKAKMNFSILKIYIVSTLIAFIYGGALEIIQGAMTKSRSADIFDFLFNIAGALLSVVVWSILKKPK